VGEVGTAGGWLVTGRNGSSDRRRRRVNGLVGDTLEYCTPAALALGEAAGRARARLTLAGLSAALGVGLAVLGAVWGAAR
jgi:hypothetical protein